MGLFNMTGKTDGSKRMVRVARARELETATAVPVHIYPYAVHSQASDMYIQTVTQDSRMAL